MPCKTTEEPPEWSAGSGQELAEGLSQRLYWDFYRKGEAGQGSLGSLGLPNVNPSSDELWDTEGSLVSWFLVRG